jgi:hypothetical protein
MHMRQLLPPRSDVVTDEQVIASHKRWHTALRPTHTTNQEQAGLPRSRILLHAPVRGVRRRSRAAVHVRGTGMRARVTGRWRPSRTAVHAGGHARPASRGRWCENLVVVWFGERDNRCFYFELKIISLRLSKSKGVEVVTSVS